MTTLPLRSARLRRSWLALLPAVVLGTLVPSSTVVAPTSQADSATRLVGVFRLAPGSCAGGRISGTHLRMILPSGTVNGPYMSNADSPCSDQSYTPLGAGSDGGLSTVGFQPAPKPAFDASGNAQAGRITARAQYYGTAFATATAATEPQSGRSVPVPTVTLRGTSLTADLRAFTVSWNKQYFNQGAPKPDGSTPGNTQLAKGTYDPATGRFTLDWASQVQGGPFDKFTGKWHLEGVFVPASSGNGGSGSTPQPGTVSPGSGTPTQPGTVQPGAAPAAGQPGADDPLAGTPGAVATPGAPLAATGAGVAPTAGVPGTRTVTERHNEWRISGPLAGTAVGLAVVAIGLIIGTRVLERRARKSVAS